MVIFIILTDTVETRAYLPHVCVQLPVDGVQQQVRRVGAVRLVLPAFHAQPHERRGRDEALRAHEGVQLEGLGVVPTLAHELRVLPRGGGRGEWSMAWMRGRG